MKLKRLASFGSALLLSLSSLLIISVPKAFAASITWNGGTDSNYNFSDGENWVGGVAPTTGDILVFRSGVTFNDPVNDMTSTVFGGVEFGAITSFECPHNGTIFDFSGSPIKLSGSIDWQDDSCAIANFDSGIELTADSSINTNDATDISSIASIVNNGHDFTAWLPTANGVDIGGISGSGNFFINGNTGQVFLSGNNTGFTGGITAYGGTLYVDGDAALGAATPGTAVYNGASLSLSSCNDGAVFGEELDLIGDSSDTSGDIPKPKLFVNSGCTGAGGVPDEIYGVGANDNTATLAGDITLGSDITFATSSKTTITSAITGSYRIDMVPGYSGSLNINSSANGSTTPNGIYAPATVKKTLSDDQSSNSVFMEGNVEITVDGKRGSVIVEKGAILKGSGTVGSLDIGDGGKVAPGHSPGCLNSGDLSFVSGATYDFEVNGSAACTEYDQIKVIGTVDLGDGTLNTILYNGFKPSSGQSYRIIDNDSSDAVTGTFKNLAEGATFTVNGYVLKISYVGGDGNDVVLSVQSVPTTPNTGANLLLANPVVTLLMTTLIAGGIGLIGRRYKKYRI